MKSIQLGKIWDTLRSSYWFVPSLMVVFSITLAFIFLSIDRAGYYGPMKEWGWIYTGGADGARSLLSSVAGSMISVTATAFSITIVALQLASSNFGPRILRNFMQDTGNQFVLGTFISTFVYSLFVLRVVQGEGEGYDIFVPHLSITFCMVLAIISTGVLIYFIHHASTIIQVSYVISEIGNELDNAIKRLFPEKVGQSEPHSRQVTEIPANFDSLAISIKSTSRGYVQAIAEDKILQIACEHNLLIKILTRPSKFVIRGSSLVTVLPRESEQRYKKLPSLQKQINETFILGRERTEQQDVRFPIDQLVEIALRALSPSLNDPFTAMRCIDRLSAGLSQLAERKFPSPYRYDDFNNLRVIAEPITFETLVHAALTPIRRNSGTNPNVTIRLLEAIALISNYTHNPKDRQTLRYHADLIFRGSSQALSESEDIKAVEQCYCSAIAALN